jgi:ABC-2 type transport system permease protein
VSATSASAAAAIPAAPKRPTTFTAYRWELRKLLSQKRTYIGLGAAALLPVVFVTVMALQHGGPYDVPLGHNLRRTGITLTLVVLTFASRFGAELVTALVAGDIVANEDSTGTLKALFTRSARRSQLLAGKTLASFTYVVAVLLAVVAAGMIAGIAAWGFNPVVNLSGVRLSAVHAFWLSFAALGVYGVPLLAIAAFGICLSTVTRNSAAAIVGTLVYTLTMEAIVGLVHVSWLPHWVLSAQFDAWHAVFRTPFVWTPVLRALWVSAIYAAIPLAIAFWYFRRRDVAGE